MDGPLKITHVMQKANVNCNVLKNYFDFLTEQGAVEEKCLERHRVVYKITERGLYLIRCFKELNQVIPIIKIRSEILQPEQRRNLPELSAKNIRNPWILSVNC
jgi:predicted transcriptional regulator